MVQFVNEAEAIEAVDGFTSSWLARDIPRKASFLTDDFVLWNNCYKVEVAKPVAVQFFDWLLTVMRNNAYYDVRRMLTPTGVIQQHLTSFDTDQGPIRDIPMLLIFTTRGNKVSRCEEYLDSTGLPKLEWPEGAKFF
ncbi:MAG: hypothetical protein JWR77_907 [Rhizorhabdus sp.]|nr:hypothetical protein [Rhizorhabdus sp.]